MHRISKPRILFREHAVIRIVQRRVPISAVSNIAQFGVTVQNDSNRSVRRGEINGEPVHVVTEGNQVVTVYFATEFESTVTVQHRHKRQK